MANAGYGTRSEIKKYISQGNVKLNGETIKKHDIQINSEKDVVLFLNKPVIYKQFTYIMLNKPPNVVSASSDKNCKCVIDLLEKRLQNIGLFPVGRLDKDTEGLLILTNNGKFAHNTLSPKKHVVKKYYAHINGVCTVNDVSSFKNGVIIDTDYRCKEALLTILESGTISKCNVEITEGKFHQIKKMFKSLGKEVIYLKRTNFGDISLDESLPIGTYRELTNKELCALEYYL